MMKKTQNVLQRKVVAPSGERTTLGTVMKRVASENPAASDLGYAERVLISEIEQAEGSDESYRDFCVQLLAEVQHQYQLTN